MPVNRQTRVKTLPSRNFVFGGGGKKMFHPVSTRSLDSVLVEYLTEQFDSVGCDFYAKKCGCRIKYGPGYCTLSTFPVIMGVLKRPSSANTQSLSTRSPEDSLDLRTLMFPSHLCSPVCKSSEWYGHQEYAEQHRLCRGCCSCSRWRSCSCRWWSSSRFVNARFLDWIAMGEGKQKMHKIVLVIFPLCKKLCSTNWGTKLINVQIFIMLCYVMLVNRWLISLLN